MLIIPEFEMPGFVILDTRAKTAFTLVICLFAPSDFINGTVSQPFTKRRVRRQNRAFF
jgi:hypothetical protein